ncbi:MAG: hypothetical protein N3H30_02650, partial [Candidatus Micrarchaeota archaeon]|nr:hypothetical protein [Candidatus Micrarchaeota archaeon]
IPLYVLAFVITLMVFAVGFMLGTVYDGIVGEGIEGRISQLSSNALSMQMFFLMENDSRFCDFYASELGRIDSDTEQLGYQIAFLEESKGFSDPELKDKYFLLEYASFLMSGRMREACGSGHKELLYFYSNKECGDKCIVQGRELLRAKEALGDRVRIYSFDCTIGSPIATSLCKRHGVSAYPTIVYGNRSVIGPLTGNEVVEMVGG